MCSWASSLTIDWSLGPPSSHPLGHEDDQEAVEFHKRFLNDTGVFMEGNLHREVIAKEDASTGVYHWVCIFICLFLGPICSELPENPFFHNFCTFSLYRCIMKRYFLKVSYLAIS